MYKILLQKNIPTRIIGTYQLYVYVCMYVCVYLSGIVYSFVHAVVFGFFFFAHIYIIVRF